MACTEFFTRNSFDRIVDDVSVPSVVFTAYSCFSFKKRCFCTRAFVFRQTSSRGNHIFLGFLKKDRCEKIGGLKVGQKAHSLGRKRFLYIN